MVKQIVLKVDGGIVDPVSIPTDVEVIVRDYDMTNTINNELIQIDRDGKEFIEIVFEETEYV